MADALRARGVSDTAAQVAAELGVLAFGLGYRRWSDPSHDDAPGELATYTATAFEELRAAAAELR
jgi:hypothetical protein